MVQKTAPSPSGPRVGEFVAKEVLRNRGTRMLKGEIEELVQDIQDETRASTAKLRGKWRSNLGKLTCFRV
jgi:hypothetical protein